MKLVVDANIAFSLLKKGSFSKKLVRRYKLELYSHPAILDELDEHPEELCRNLKVSLGKFNRIREIFSKLVNLKNKPSPQQLNRAKSLISDPDDSPYLALAFKLGIDIWSNDPHLKEQSIVRVFRTDELADSLKNPSDFWGPENL